MSEVTIQYGDCYSFCLTRTVYPILYKQFSVKNPNAYWIMKSGKTSWDGVHRYFSNLTGKFATGLLGMIVQVLEKKGYTVRIIGNLPKKIPFKNEQLTGITLESHQIEVVKKGLTYGRGIVDAATNAGKSACMCALIKEIKQPTLILVHKVLLFENIKKTIIDKFNGYEPGEINRKSINLKKITIGMVGVLSNLIAKKDLKIKHYLANQVKVLMGDEIHHLGQSNNTWRKVFMNCNAPYRFGFSGTPLNKENSNDFNIIGFTGPVLISISNEYLIKNKISAVPEIRFINIQCDNLIDQTMKYLKVYNTYIVKNPYLHQIVNKICKSHKNVLVLVKELEHGAILEKYIKNSKFMYGDLKDGERNSIIKDFTNNKLNTIIATSILDEGVDIVNIKTLVLAVGGVSKVVLQRIGRALRRTKEKTNVIIYDFEYNVKYLRGHSAKRKKMYADEKFKVIENYKL